MRFRSFTCLFLLGLLGLALAQEPSPVDDSEDDSADSSPPPAPAQIDYSTPAIEGQFLYEHFDDPDQFAAKWVKSTSNKGDSSELKYDGEWARVETQAPLKGMTQQTFIDSLPIFGNLNWLFASSALVFPVYSFVFLLFLRNHSSSASLILRILWASAKNSLGCICFGCIPIFYYVHAALSITILSLYLYLSLCLGDFALMTQSKARHHAYSAKLNKPFKFNSKPFVLQYEVIALVLYFYLTNIFCLN